MLLQEMVASKPFWTRVALLGFAAFLIMNVVYAVVSIITGEAANLFFVAINVIAVAIAIAAMLRLGHWGHLVAAFIALIGVFFFGSSAAISLQSPDSVLDFTFITVGILGLVVTIVSCVIAFFRLRRGTATQTGSVRAVMAVRGIVAFMVLSAVASTVLTLVSKDTVSAAEKQGAVELSAKKSDWNTDSLSVKSGSSVKILVENSDPYIHTFTVKDLDVDVRLKPGSEKLITLKSPGAGGHEYICNIHTDMKGTLTVQ